MGGYVTSARTQAETAGLLHRLSRPRHWSSPTAVIDLNLAQTLVRTVALLSSSAEVVTSREIELWVEHLQPVWNRHPSWRERALENELVRVSSD